MNQISIKSLSDQDLILSTERIVEQERKIVQVLIWHLQEIQDRRLFLSMGFVSLYECLIQHFKMSDTTAYGRIKVLKILEDVPEICESLKTGELNISNIALAHSFIEKHQKLTGEELSSREKVDLIENLKNKTTSEVKELLARCNPDTALPHDEIKILTKSHSQLKSTVSIELVKKIEYLKSLISHENINPTHEELLAMAFDALIEKVEKKKGIRARASKALVQKPDEKPTQRLTDGNSRYLSRGIKRIVFKRANGQCEHVHIDGRRCTSKFQTQYDHVIAFSKGGKSTLENSQLLCRVHNAAKSNR